MIFWCLLSWVMLTLTVARLTQALVLEEISDTWRSYLDTKAENSRFYDFLSRMHKCYWCTSFWVSGISSAPLAVTLTLLSPLQGWKLLLGVVVWPYVWASVAYAAAWIMDHEG